MEVGDSRGGTLLEAPQECTCESRGGVFIRKESNDPSERADSATIGLTEDIPLETTIKLTLNLEINKKAKSYRLSER